MQMCDAGTCMYQCTHWGFVDFIHIQDIFKDKKLPWHFSKANYLITFSILIYRRKSREIFPCVMLINVRMTKADRCLLKD